MRLETSKTIYEDTMNKLVPYAGSLLDQDHEITDYICSCGEPKTHNVKSREDIPGAELYYTFTCDCGNEIKVYVKDSRLN